LGEGKEWGKKTKERNREGKEKGMGAKGRKRRTKEGENWERTNTATVAASVIYVNDNDNEK